MHDVMKERENRVAGEKFVEKQPYIF